jgi:quercetin dioxygenase-like cupin family protein
MAWLDFNTTPHRRLRDGIHGAIHHSDQLTFARIVLEAGAVLPAHNHVHEQWTHILAGQMEFTMDGETRILGPGMAVFIPSMTLHAARALTRCEALDCFLPVREDFKSLEPWTEG